MKKKLLFIDDQIPHFDQAAEEITVWYNQQAFLHMEVEIYHFLAEGGESSGLVVGHEALRLSTNN